VPQLAANRDSAQATVKEWAASFTPCVTGPPTNIDRLLPAKLSLPSAPRFVTSPSNLPPTGPTDDDES
jgi:hypothetical protein